MFSEMVEWAVDEGADMLIGETFYYAEEAYTALKVMQKTGLPSVITIAPMAENIMRDGVGIVDTCKELEQRGGAYYSDVACDLLASIYSNEGRIHVVNIKNNGHVNKVY